MEKPGSTGAVKRFNRTSLLIQGLALLIVLSSIAQTWYRLSLPTEGWSFARDTSGTSMRLVFDRNLSGLTSPFKAGDTISAIDGIPYETILSAALSSRPQRPTDWAAGQTVIYNIKRSGQELEIPAHLIQLNSREILANLWLNLLPNPGPLLTLLIGIFVFYRLPRSTAARLLLLFSAAVFSSDGVSQIVSGTNVIGPAELFFRAAYWPSQFFNSLIWPLIIAPIYVHLFFTFPGLKAPLRQYPRLALILLYGYFPLLTLVVALFLIGRPLTFWRTWSTLTYIDFVLVLTVAILTMIHTLLTVREPTSRAQIRWVAWGTLITSIGSLAGSLVVTLGLVGGNLLAAWSLTRLMLLGFPITVAIAILRYHLFDIDIIINRTLVYSIVTALLALVYFGSVAVFQQLFRAAMGANSPLAVVLSTLVIAALFTPLRTRIQEIIDRRFYRSRYDAIRAMAAFGITARDEVELERLINRLESLVSETMQPNQVSIWLRNPNDRP